MAASDDVCVRLISASESQHLFLVADAVVVISLPSLLMSWRERNEMRMPSVTAVQNATADCDEEVENKWRGLSSMLVSRNRFWWLTWSEFEWTNWTLLPAAAAELAAAMETAWYWGEREGTRERRGWVCSRGSSLIMFMVFIVFVSVAVSCEPLSTRRQPF